MYVGSLLLFCIAFSIVIAQPKLSPFLIFIVKKSKGKLISIKSKSEKERQLSTRKRKLERDLGFGNKEKKQSADTIT